MNLSKKTLLTAALGLVLFAMHADAQKYFTRDGMITFSSDAPLEKIEAINKKATSVLDVETGALEFAVLIKSFHFEKALMEEHFNENYMESGKYPKASFKGTVANVSDIHFSHDGEYPVTVSGEMTIHGTTQPVTAQGVFKVAGGSVSATSKFEVSVADYNIKVPKVVKDNIAEIVEISVAIDFKLLEQ